MAEFPYLSRAPVTEALVDFRVKLPESTDLEKLSSIYQSISSDYPKKQERMKMEGEIDIKSGKFISRMKSVDGYIYRSGDEKQVVQTRLDGFTFSRLKPYQNWKTLRHEALRLWEIYSEVAEPEAVTRLALRYINLVEIPLPINDFSQYLTSPPIIPDKLPQEINNFLIRYTFHHPLFAADAIITQSLKPIAGGETPTHLPMILDIDVFTTPSSANQKPEKLWGIIDRLREFKNTVFFSSITTETVELFK